MLGLMFVAVVFAITAGLVVYTSPTLPLSTIGFVTMIIIGLVSSGLILVFLCVAKAVACHDLRIAHEGVESEEIAAVFDLARLLEREQQ